MLSSEDRIWCVCMNVIMRQLLPLSAQPKQMHITRFYLWNVNSPRVRCIGVC